NVGAPDTATFTDQGNGNFTVTGAGVQVGSFVNYATGKVVLQFTALGGGATITANITYFPTLPVMGITLRDLAFINDYQTIWFDTKYAYIWNGTDFQEFIPGTTWNGTNSDFFWSTNYRGVNPQDRLFFTTNFVNDTLDPIRYTDGNTWTDFTPVLAATDEVTQIIGNISQSGSTFTGTIPGGLIIPGSVEITVAGISFSDPTGSGTLTGNPNTNTGTINYTTGVVVLNFNPTINFSGTITNITNGNPGIVTSAAHNLTTGAQVTITGVNGMTQVNGQTYTIIVVNPNQFSIGNTLTFGAYTNGGKWILAAASLNVTATYGQSSSSLFQARIIIPYFGRLVALNVFEGSSVANAVNIYNRCRFSQVGSPIDTNAWRTDIFGRGGFIDAPTNEMITGCTFLNNTLIVFFEDTTWQLRYVGEYGLPFIWERIASDLGSDSTFSPVLFNRNILAIGDKAIISADSNTVNRIDINIPDQIFDFQNENNGPERVQGIRDYQKELVFWNYADAQTQTIDPDEDEAIPITFPNKVLVYDYRNDTWAIFRDSVTAFGTFQLSVDVTWDSQSIFWADDSVTWDDVDNEASFPRIVSGNQQGFIHYYGYTFPDEPSLTMTGITQLTINDHNLLKGEIIYITNMQFVDSSTLAPITTNLSNQFFQVLQVNNANTITLASWSFQLQEYIGSFTTTFLGFTPANAIYIGGGQATLFSPPYIQTKDFNPYQMTGLQTKLSYIDFLMQTIPPPDPGFITLITKANPCQITSTAHGLQTGQKVMISNVGGMTQLNTSNFYTVTVVDANDFTINVDSTSFGNYIAGTGQWVLLTPGMSIILYLNTSQSILGNLSVGNTQVQTSLTKPFYRKTSDLAWFRFYATAAAQYFNIVLTYDDNLMNTLNTHDNDLVMVAINAWVAKGGKILF